MEILEVITCMSIAIIYTKVVKICSENMSVLEAVKHTVGVVRRMHIVRRNLLGCCFPKWERCGLGGKQRVRFCHLIPTPSFRETPTKGVRPYKEFLRLLCFKMFFWCMMRMGVF